MSAFDRNGRIISRKFFQFLLPTVLSTVAVSLNEFVDSIIVSHLLGHHAMSMVGMASPVMLLFAVIYMLLGTGGSVVYAEYAGRQRQDKSDSAFSVVFYASVLTGALISVTGVIFIDRLSLLLCREDSLIAEFTPYLTVLLISGFVIIPLQVLIIFFPAFGKPHLGTIINITANGINILMDYVYIRFFDTGLAGASMATLTGYIMGILIVIVLIISKRISLNFVRTVIKDLYLLYESLKKGVAVALSQFGYCVKIHFCNHLSVSLLGLRGIMIFTLCMQCVSIVSIAIGGIVASMVPIASALRGQRDFRGIRMLMNKVMTAMALSSVLFFLLFEIWPGMVTAIYNVKSTHMYEVIAGIRIFSVMFLFRGFVIVFMYYFQIMSRNIYAVLISMIDGFAGIIPLALILTRIYGIYGLWMTFPVLAFIMIIVIVTVNYLISARSKGKYSGILVLPNEDPDVPVYDATVPLDKDKIENIVCSLQEFCNSHLRSEKTSVMIAVAFEEMISYTADKRGKNHSTDECDVLLKIFPDEVLLDVRSVGKPHDPSTAPADDYSNVDVLRKVASSIEYNYVMGMNQTRIRLLSGV